MYKDEQLTHLRLTPPHTPGYLTPCGLDEDLVSTLGEFEIDPLAVSYFHYCLSCYAAFTHRTAVAWNRGGA